MADVDILEMPSRHIAYEQCAVLHGHNSSRCLRPVYIDDINNDVTFR